MAQLRVSGVVGESQFTAAREIRNLAHLNRTASSARVLNLAKLYVHFREEEAYKEMPLFENSGLNRAIILKHTLRVDERHLFNDSRQTVTKIILPYDPYDLRLGGRSIFYRQVGFDALMRGSAFVVTGEGSLDEQTLQGKIVGEVATRCRQAGVTCHAIVGRNQLDPFGQRIIDLASVTEATTLAEIHDTGAALIEQ